MHLLNPAEQAVLRLRYGIDEEQFMDAVEVAGRLRLSRAEVTELESEGIGKIKALVKLSEAA